ncbi:restriction endonuclease [Kitasatospora sp. NPDC056076]|uniref:restriction endonuclease n=1 Tax=Kitasatospora sp. NPDC056076 TaxID=3345703 RepID=UPI0035D75943
MVDWGIELGERLKRVAIHETYGGRRQGGIGPSRVSENVLLFTDPATGHKHGYFDGWATDGCYHYAGEGQVGDQRMTQGNLSVLKHKEEGRALRLFRAGVAPGMVEYLGEFELDADEPWYQTDAPETNGGPIRRVIMFKLRPVTVGASTGPKLPHTPTAHRSVELVDVEQQRTEQYFVDPSHEPYEAERREASLVAEYAGYLRLEGHEVRRQMIKPAGELKPLLTDLYDVTTGKLIEAKGTVTREAVRMALGQLLDYSRHIEPTPSLAILVPSEPRPDLLDLCDYADVEVIWPVDGAWHSTGDRQPRTSTRSAP